MLEQPYRIVPGNIVLRKGHPYQLVIQTGDEWHHFQVDEFGLGIDIPSNTEIMVEVEPQRVGVYSIVNIRRLPESHTLHTITVIPSQITPSSWQFSCAELNMHSPPPYATVSTPFVIEGSVGQVEIPPFGGTLHATRIEVWGNGEQVGLAHADQISFKDAHSDFYVTVLDLPPGKHNLVIRVHLQNDILAATATLPITVLPEGQASGSTIASRGSIDIPAADSLLGQPVSLRGWAAVFGSSDGTGVGAVEIWNGPKESSYLLAEATHGTYRPDVAEAFGEPRFASSGWFTQISNLPVGPVDLHLYVRDSRTGAYVAPFAGETPPTRKITLAEEKLVDSPWPVALAAAPDGRLFFAELLTGRIRIWENGQVASKLFATLDDISIHYESGLLGLALHPGFPDEPYVYAMYVVENPETGLPLMQRVVRFRDEGGIGVDYSVILEDLPATRGRSHNGGRIAFGPDGMLYVVIGDLEDPELVQDLASTAGSILRYTPDGSVPEDNPTPGSPIYAYGLRNVFGLAFQPGTDALYATENGPGGFDEVNKIEAGHNYGWPLHMAIADEEGFTDPIVVYGLWPDIPTYGPTGATFPLDRPDLLLFCAYHIQALHALQLSGPDYTTVDRQLRLSDNCVLDVTASSDGWLYYSSLSAIYRARLEDLLRLHEIRSP
jgi:hypothetical protein